MVLLAALLPDALLTALRAEGLSTPSARTISRLPPIGDLSMAFLGDSPTRLLLAVLFAICQETNRLPD